MASVRAAFVVAALLVLGTGAANLTELEATLEDARQAEHDAWAQSNATLDAVDAFIKELNVTAHDAGVLESIASALRANAVAPFESQKQQVKADLNEINSTLQTETDPVLLTNLSQQMDEKAKELSRLNKEEATAIKKANNDWAKTNKKRASDLCNAAKHAAKEWKKAGAHTEDAAKKSHIVHERTAEKQGLHTELAAEKQYRRGEKAGDKAKKIVEHVHKLLEKEADANEASTELSGVRTPLHSVFAVVCVGAVGAFVAFGVAAMRRQNLARNELLKPILMV